VGKDGTSSAGGFDLGIAWRSRTTGSRRRSFAACGVDGGFAEAYAAAVADVRSGQMDEVQALNITSRCVWVEVGPMWCAGDGDAFIGKCTSG